MHRATVEDAVTMVEEILKVCASNTLYQFRSLIFCAIDRIDRRTTHRARSSHFSDGFIRRPNQPIQTKEGKQRLKFQMQLYYGKTLFESWTDGNKLQASIAPMFKGADEESVTMATAIKMMMAKRSDLSAAVRQLGSHSVYIVLCCWGAKMEASYSVHRSHTSAND